MGLHEHLRFLLGVALFAFACAAPRGAIETTELRVGELTFDARTAGPADGAP